MSWPVIIRFATQLVCLYLSVVSTLSYYEVLWQYTQAIFLYLFCRFNNDNDNSIIFIMIIELFMLYKQLSFALCVLKDFQNHIYRKAFEKQVLYKRFVVMRTNSNLSVMFALKNRSFRLLWSLKKSLVVQTSVVLLLLYYFCLVYVITTLSETI